MPWICPTPLPLALQKTPRIWAVPTSGLGGNWGVQTPLSATPDSCYYWLAYSVNVLTYTLDINSIDLLLTVWIVILLCYCMHSSDLGCSHKWPRWKLGGPDPTQCHPWFLLLLTCVQCECINMYSWHHLSWLTSCCLNGDIAVLVHALVIIIHIVVLLLRREHAT